MIKVKKKRINCAFNVNNAAEKMSFEQIQKHSINKCKRFTIIRNIQKVVSMQNQQQLQMKML